MLIWTNKAIKDITRVQCCPVSHFENMLFLHRLFLATMCKHDVIDKTGSTQNIALPSVKQRATAIGNVPGISGEVWTISSICMWTGRQTGTLHTILCSQTTDFMPFSWCRLLHSPTGFHKNFAILSKQRYFRIRCERRGCSD